MAVEPPEAPGTTGTPEIAADPFVRAVAAARAEEPEGWLALSDAVMAEVRAVVVPAYPVLVRELADGSRTFVSTRVVTAALRQVLSTQPTHAPSGIRLHLDGNRLDGLDLAVVAAYGVDLVALAEVVRAAAVDAVAALLGAPTLRPVDVGVDVVDVVDGDPRRV